jgi:dynactin complex subunit
MTDKKTIEIIDQLNNRLERMQADIQSIKLDLAKNERVTTLENKMAAMEVKVWVLFGALVLVASAFVGYYFKTNG